ncbi:uncharacterized protein I206_101957 [Kwoniella pini CBS 10737]|uniref:Uncharacterized protein n=1 Tax=Kwoniella pini CBS 10737 TaxID=1296096 RepID=A0A1B9HV80_9TREE|nr:uncharacterized protein I206_06952 [Kwoniella pini CBS 10737]OCF47174.1 hypothetical protein I206_06952 [Kwoniella pini CBS 10737]
MSDRPLSQSEKSIGSQKYLIENRSMESSVTSAASDPDGRSMYLTNEDLGSDGSSSSSAWRPPGCEDHHSTQEEPDNSGLSGSWSIIVSSNGSS